MNPSSPFPPKADALPDCATLRDGKTAEIAFADQGLGVKADPVSQRSQPPNNGTERNQREYNTAVIPEGVPESDAETARTLRWALGYDTATGVFTWLHTATGHQAGASAGSLSKRGYVIITWRGKKHKAHRLAWFYVHGRWPVAGLDHRNRNYSDNRIANLREANHVQNGGNQRRNKRNKTGHPGVYFWHGKYQCCIQISRKQMHLGSFDSLDAAAAAYRAAAERHRGEFAGHLTP